jgi:hypothetical protein
MFGSRVKLDKALWPLKRYRIASTPRVEEFTRTP